MMWFKHSRRIGRINRSAKLFCQGEAGAIGLPEAMLSGRRLDESVPITRERCDHQALRSSNSRATRGLLVRCISH